MRGYRDGLSFGTGSREERLKRLREEVDSAGAIVIGAGKALSMRLPHDMVPADPESGLAVAMNLRSDDSFVEDAGWRRASASYAAFLRANEKEHVLFWEMGVGANTPVLLTLSTRGTKKAPKMDVFKQETGFGEDVILAERRCA